jgi:hypothetical protein
MGGGGRTWNNVSWPAPRPVSWPASRSVSWPGLARPPMTSYQTNRKIVPAWVLGDDQTHFPGSWPALHAGLALDCGGHVFVRFCVYEPVQFISSGECRSGAGLMLANPADEVVCYAKVQRSVRTVGHDVDPAGGHASDRSDRLLRKGLQNGPFPDSCTWSAGQVVGGRAKPSHDTECADRATKYPDHAPEYNVTYYNGDAHSP